MAEIQSYYEYLLDDLVEAAELPWREFAEWADERMPEPYDVNTSLSRFSHGYHNPCNSGYPGPDKFATWQNMAVDMAYHTFHSILWGRAGELLEEVTGIENNHRDLLSGNPAALYKMDQAIKQLVENLRYGREIENPSLREAAGVRRSSEVPIKQEHLQELRWARWCLRGEWNHERAFWVQVRNAVREELPMYCSIDEAIREKVPLSDEQHQTLFDCTQHGVVRPITLHGESAEVSVRICLEPLWGHMNMDDVTIRAQALMVPIAYQLSVQWSQSMPWPRYVIQCRNPQCGKRFYSGDQKAVACPKAVGETGKSSCKRTWDAYRKWLADIGSDPDLDWNKDDLKRDFLYTYRPRGSQVPSQF
jgi:hypothetical protein